MNWNDTPFTVLDTETTGFRETDRVVELALLHFVGGKVTERLVRRVNPGIPIPVEASQIHGIYDRDVASSPRFSEISHEVLTWLHETPGPLIAHNFAFDMRMLGYDLPRGTWPLERRVACTMRHAQKRHPVLSLRRKGHKVVDLAQFFAIPFDESQAHGAEYDARITGMFAPLLFGPLLVDETTVRLEDFDFERRW